MPQLVWEPLDLLDVLGVLPFEEELGISHRYVIEQGGVKLQLTIRQYDSDIEFLLWAGSLPEPILRYRLLDCPGLRLVDDKRGAFIEFGASNSFTGRYDGYSPMPYGLRLWTKPQLFLEPFSYAI